MNDHRNFGISEIHDDTRATQLVRGELEPAPQRHPAVALIRDVACYGLAVIGVCWLIITLAAMR